MARATDKHRHNHTPALSLGENPDGSARWWVCECGHKIRFDPSIPITVGRAR